ERRRRELATVRAVLAVDDLRAMPQEAQRLLQEAPGCRVLVASRRRVLMQVSRLRMGGLAGADAAALVALELGRPVEPRDSALADILTGHPLLLRQAASLCADAEIEPWALAAALGEDAAAAASGASSAAAGDSRGPSSGGAGDSRGASSAAPAAALR